MLRPAGKCAHGVKLDKPWNEMWTIDVCELAICLRSFLNYPDCSSGALCTQI